jgi:hypothetical protein
MTGDRSPSHHLHPAIIVITALIKKKIKFSSYMRKFRREQLQSHLRLTASSYMTKYWRISSYIRKPFLIYMTVQLFPSEYPYIRGIFFSFLSVRPRSGGGRVGVNYSTSTLGDGQNSCFFPFHLFYTYL